MGRSVLPRNASGSSMAPLVGVGQRLRTGAAGEEDSWDSWPLALDSKLHLAGAGVGTCSSTRSLVGLILPAVLVLGVLVCVAEGLRQPVSRDTEEHPKATSALAMACFFALVDNMSFAIVIPDSFSLVRRLGASPAISGAFVGMSKFGMAFGAMATFAILRIRSDAWRVWAQILWRACASCCFVGAGMYLYITMAAREPSFPRARGSTAPLVILLLGRCFAGAGAGMRMMLGRAMICHLNEGKQRPRHMECFVFAIMLGLGLGPLLASSVKTFDALLCEAHRQRYEGVGLVAFALALSQLVTALRFPSLSDDGIDDHGSVQASSESDVESEDLNQAIIVLCLAYSTLRALIVSGVEVGSSMMLELEFGWSAEQTGAVLGLAFLCCIPLRRAYIRHGQRLSPVLWMLLLLGVAALGCFGYFKIPSDYLLHLQAPWATRLQVAAVCSADALVFPSIFHSDALNQGILYQHLCPVEGRWLNIYSVSLMQTFLVDGFSRSIGPLLARGTISLYGRSWYALLQLLLVGVAVLTVAVGLMPRVRKQRRPVGRRAMHALKG